MALHDAFFCGTMVALQSHSTVVFIPKVYKGLLECLLEGLFVGSKYSKEKYPKPHRLLSIGTGNLAYCS